MTPVRCAALLLACLVVGTVFGSRAAAQAPTSVTVTTPAGDVNIVADHLEQIGPDNLLVATGNVEITRGPQRLTADRVELNRATGDVVAEGRAVFYDGQEQLLGDRIEYNYRTGSGVVYDGRSRVPPYYRIGGERMERLGEGQYRVRQGTFTTCEDDPPTWSFHFGDGTADFESYVYGTDASFWVKNIPVIPFFPFFAAAIRRERQTGFLFPRFGSSSRKGLFTEVPFFWAISDSQDALITLDTYERVGLGLNLEYRYFLARDNFGSLRGFYVNEFRRGDRSQEEGVSENRGWVSIKHEWAIGGGWGFTADVNHVSDDRLFRDYGDALAVRDAQRVESNVFLTKTWPAASLVGNLFFYQDLTTASAVELQRLPDIRFFAQRQPLPWVPEDSRILGEVTAQYVNFVREVGSAGQRLDILHLLARPFSPGGFFTVTPFVGGRLTAYDKTVTGLQTVNNGTLVIETTNDEARLRRLVQMGSDLEARATRIYQVGGVAGIDALQHAIEPRVNYTFIDGTDLIKQTGTATFKPNKLPQWDAIDAIPETSLFTYSLTNRVRARTVAPEGTEPVRWELIRFVLTQTYDLHNDTRPFGDIISTLIVNPNRIFSLRADTNYNVYGDGLRTSTVDLGVSVPRFTATVGTRVARDRVVNLAGSIVNQTTQSSLQGTMRAEVFPWMVTRFSTNADMKRGVFIETRSAVDLRWQCWAFTVEYVNRHNDEDEIRFALNLLGVGQPLQFGTGVSTLTGATPGGAR